MPRRVAHPPRILEPSRTRRCARNLVIFAQDAHRWRAGMRVKLMLARIPVRTKTKMRSLRISNWDLAIHEIAGQVSEDLALEKNILVTFFTNSLKRGGLHLSFFR